MSERTLGLGVGLSSGCGFIVRRLEGDGRWSAPCYLTSRSMSLGLLMGASALYATADLFQSCQLRACSSHTLKPVGYHTSSKK